LVDSVEIMMMHRLANPKFGSEVWILKKTEEQRLETAQISTQVFLGFPVPISKC
jgi:hypothetical protein